MEAIRGNMVLSACGDGSALVISFPDGAVGKTSLYDLYAEIHGVCWREVGDLIVDCRKNGGSAFDAERLTKSLVSEMGMSPCLAKALAFSDEAAECFDNGIQGEPSGVGRIADAVRFVVEDLKRDDGGLLAERGTPAIVSRLFAGGTFVEQRPELEPLRNLPTRLAVEIVRDISDMANPAARRFFEFVGEQGIGPGAKYGSAVAHVRNLEESLELRPLDESRRGLLDLAIMLEEWCISRLRHSESVPAGISGRIDWSDDEVTRQMATTLRTIAMSDDDGGYFLDDVERGGARPLKPSTEVLVRAVSRHPGRRWAFSGVVALAFLCIHLASDISESERAHHRLCGSCGRPFISSKRNPSYCTRTHPGAGGITCDEYQHRTSSGRATRLAKYYSWYSSNIRNQLSTCAAKYGDPDAAHLYDAGKHAVVLTTRGFYDELYKTYASIKSQNQGAIPDHVLKEWFASRPKVTKAALRAYKERGSFPLCEIGFCGEGGEGTDAGWLMLGHSVPFPDVPTRPESLEAFKSEHMEIGRRLAGELCERIANCHGRLPEPGAR